ncbi:hypothetical protein Clacol_010269 [Clathrus columnatus]|uniref:Uncharacterized protein n=1 Tax=Clathrus columnatus TaxID=1419009 RepID=A0AAV5ANE9_9AGAM|nr:hypothetical protein Clacol_010269 [Clathrus columnatus]
MLDIRWNTTAGCFTTQGVDIYLYAPYSAQGLIHVWQGIDYGAGSFQTPIQGSWWNSTLQPITLQLGVVQSNTPIFTSPVGLGPLFTATFNVTDFELKNPVGATTANSTTPTSNPTSKSSGGIFQIINNAYKNLGLPKGSIAAAVLVPLIVIAIGVAVYLKYYRKKEAEKRKRWSEAVDKRMSAISSDWKTLPPGAQSEAIRQSIAIMRHSRASMARMSQTDFRPVSIATTQSGNGSMTNSTGMRKGTGVGLRNPALGPAQMAARKSVASYASTNRKSTISFAADTKFSSLDIPDVPDLPSAISRPSGDKPRPSIDTQRGRASRAFHTAFTPDDAAEFEISSPEDRNGPKILPDDLRASVYIKDENVLPALNVMAGDELLFTSSPLNPSFSPIASPPPSKLSPSVPDPFSDNTPYSPSYANISHSSLPLPDPVSAAMAHAPVYVSPISNPPPVATSSSPFAGFSRGPSNFMTPDAMLRAYASGSTPGTPMAANPCRSVTPPTRTLSFKSKRTSTAGSSKGTTQRSSGGSGSPKYAAFDAPATPEPVTEMDLEENGSGRMVYTPHRGAPRSSAGSDEAYGGYGMAN